ncbi:hypothetical protein BKA62DRAFT_392207 [Auriculariales sp. MPI-PUGE-AT-0066]|nr:hypothetical protein BKA62DRAFT_392207 [Auriculariales sp. MPI-PUGE-AT-0066]
MAEFGVPKTPTTPRSIRAKVGKPRVLVPVSVKPSDPLWDEARGFDVGARHPASSSPETDVGYSNSLREGSLLRLGDETGGTPMSLSDFPVPPAPPMPLSNQPTIPATAGPSSVTTLLSHPATATVPGGKVGARVHNLLARMQTQVESRAVQRTVVNISVRGRVQQVAAHHGGSRQSVLVRNFSVSPERGSSSSHETSSAGEPFTTVQASSKTTTSQQPAARPSLELDMSVLDRPETTRSRAVVPASAFEPSREPETAIDARGPISAVDNANGIPTPRRRMRAAQWSNLQHGMLRQSRVGGTDSNDDLLTRLSLYDDSAAGTFSPGGLLRAADALDTNLAANRLGSLTEGVALNSDTRPSTSGPVPVTGRKGPLRAVTDLAMLRLPLPSRHKVAEQEFTATTAWSVHEPASAPVFPAVTSTSTGVPKMTSAPNPGSSVTTGSGLVRSLSHRSPQMESKQEEEDLGYFPRVASPVTDERPDVGASASRTSRKNTPSPEFYPTMAEILAEQDAEDARLRTEVPIEVSEPFEPTNATSRVDISLDVETKLSGPSQGSLAVVTSRTYGDAMDLPAAVVRDPSSSNLPRAADGPNARLKVSPLRAFDGPISASADSDIIDSATSPSVPDLRPEVAAGPTSPSSPDVDHGFDLEVPFTFPDGDLRTSRVSAVPSSAGFRSSFLPPAHDTTDELDEEYAALAVQRGIVHPDHEDIHTARVSFDSEYDTSNIELDVPYTFPNGDGRLMRASAIPSSAGMRSSFSHSRTCSAELDEEYITLRRGSQDSNANAEEDEQEHAERAAFGLVATPLSIQFDDVERVLLPHGRSSSSESQELSRLRQSAFEAEFSPAPSRHQSRSPAARHPPPSPAFGTLRPDSFGLTTAGLSSEFSATPHSIAFTDVERVLDLVAPPSHQEGRFSPDEALTEPEGDDVLVVEPDFRALSPASPASSPRYSFTPTSPNGGEFFSLPPTRGAASFDINELDQWPYSPTTSSSAHGTDARFGLLESPRSFNASSPTTALGAGTSTSAESMNSASVTSVQAYRGVVLNSPLPAVMQEPHLHRSSETSHQRQLHTHFHRT